MVTGTYFLQLCMFCALVYFHVTSVVHFIWFCATVLGSQFAWHQCLQSPGLAKCLPFRGILGWSLPPHSVCQPNTLLGTPSGEIRGPCSAHFNIISIIPLRASSTATVYLLFVVSYWGLRNKSHERLHAPCNIACIVVYSVLDKV
jgi:hypothetical protein